MSKILTPTELGEIVIATTRASQHVMVPKHLWPELLEHMAAQKTKIESLEIDVNFHRNQAIKADRRRDEALELAQARKITAENLHNNFINMTRDIRIAVEKFKTELDGILG